MPGHLAALFEDRERRALRHHGRSPQRAERLQGAIRGPSRGELLKRTAH
jgi:hypothetical protein